MMNVIIANFFNVISALLKYLENKIVIIMNFVDRSFWSFLTGALAFFFFFFFWIEFFFASSEYIRNLGTFATDFLEEWSRVKRCRSKSEDQLLIHVLGFYFRKIEWRWQLRQLSFVKMFHLAAVVITIGSSSLTKHELPIYFPWKRATMT